MDDVFPRYSNPPNVALLHDWLVGFRGGERVLESFCELFPAATIYTLLHAKSSTSDKIESHKIVTSFMQNIPGALSGYRKMLPLMPAAAESIKIADVDVVLSSSHCVIKGVPKPKGARHISYIHSPMRYMYDQYENYFGNGASLPVRLGGKIFRRSITKWDIESNKNVDVMIANSQFVRERIRKFYERDAEVIYPFVDFTDFENTTAAKSDFFVMVTAFAPNKRVDLAIQTFNELKMPLLIIGSGQLDSELRAMAGPTIQFLGNVSRAKVVETLQSARALIFPGVEDFGITPLEAIAAKTPVIAFKAGGVLETLTDETAIFFDQPTLKSLKSAVLKFEKEGRNADPSAIRRFSKERFQSEILEVVNSNCGYAN